MRKISDIQRVFAFDCETFLVAPGRQIPPMVCLSYVYADDKGVVGEPRLLHARFDRMQLRRVLRAALEDPEVVLVGANVAFDLAVCCLEFPELLPLVFAAYAADRVYCVQVAQRLIDIATNRFGGLYVPGDDGGQVWVEYRYDLASLVRRHLGVSLDKDTWRLKYGTLIDTPCAEWPEGAREYSLGDSASTLGVLYVQASGAMRDPALPTGASVHFNADDLLCDVWNQTRAQWWLHLMAAHGIVTDPVMVAKLRALIEAEVARIFPGLVEAGLVSPPGRGAGKRNTKIAKARMKEICDRHGIALKTTAAGDVALDEEACLDSGDPLLVAYASYTSLRTILSKDIPALEKPIIQSRFETLVETGRTSCSGGKTKKGVAPSSYSYQLQNVRRKLGLSGVDEDHIGVRQCFVPRRGCYFVSCDYSMQELCSWAQVSYTLCGMTKLRDALNAGRDVHLALGARLIGMSYEEALAQKKEPRVKDARQMAKAGNFGFPGGLSWRSFMAYAKASYGLRLSPDEAKSVLKAWEEEWEPAPYFDMIRKLTEHGGGEVVHLFSGRRRAWVPFTVACNSFFQGLAADCSKDAGFRVSRACYVGKDSPLFGSRIVNFIHDELLLEVPVDRAHEAAHECARLMMEAGKTWMPDCPPKVEPALMTRWIKAAEPKYDEKGRLVPWA